MSDLMFSRGPEPEDREKMTGLSVGVVSQNKDPEGLGRVKVRLPWKAPDESHWARVATPMAGKGRGIWFLPEVGDEVVVAGDMHNIEHLYVIGSLWNGKEPPPQKNGDGRNDLRVIRSRSGHEIVFDDGAQGRIDIHLKDNGRVVRLDPGGIQIKDGVGNSIEIQTTSGQVSIKSKVKVVIESNVIELKANASMTLQASGVLTIQGALVRIN